MRHLISHMIRKMFFLQRGIDVKKVPNIEIFVMSL